MLTFSVNHEIMDMKAGRFMYKMIVVFLKFYAYLLCFMCVCGVLSAGLEGLDSALIERGKTQKELSSHRKGVLPASYYEFPTVIRGK
jgi:hypothetical protein